MKKAKRPAVSLPKYLVKMKIELKKHETPEVKEAQDKAFSRLMSDQVFVAHLQALELTEQLILKNKAPLIAYYESYLSVQECKKAGSCINEEAYHNLSISLHNDYINLKHELCPVLALDELKQTRFIFNDIPSGYEKVSLKTITERKTQRTYLKAILSLMKNEINTIYVYGAFGTGKLTLALGAVNQIVDRDENLSVGVIDFRSFVTEYSNNYYDNKNLAQNALDKVLAVDLLVVREFGNEESNKLTRDVFSFPLVLERIKSGKKTIFISELSLDDLSQLYDPSNRDVRVKQIIQTLKANAREVNVTGVNI